MKYVKETGETQVPKDFVFEDFNLGKWVSKQREAYARKTIRSDRKKLLNDLNFIWSPTTGVHNLLTESLMNKPKKSKIASEITLKKTPWES